MTLLWITSRLHRLTHIFERLLGLTASPSLASKVSRFGLAVSGGLLALAGLFLITIDTYAIWAIIVATGLVGYGLFNIASALRKNSTLVSVNKLSLAGYLTAVVSLYLIVSKVFIVGYATDTLVGTYMGLLRVLQLQSPYGLSIKPLLDQFGFSPSFYTPGIDGSFDFNVAYPSISFLPLLPFYVLGMTDIRDSIFIFHLLSILLIFALVPAKWKSASLAPFGLFPFVIAGGWTDSVWAFFLVLTASLWYKHPKASSATLGLAIAAKQIAVAVTPFLMIRLWKENTQSRLRALTTNLGLMLSTFFLPNIPFIIASPGAWWKDIVAPYLPNAPAQIPGGIGLSEILLDLGIALPPAFYLVLMTGAFTLMLYAYARHYRGLNSMVFAFPILMFFFYYRSFPNYLVYWVLPFALECARIGKPNLRALTLIHLPAIAWRPSVGPIFNFYRRRITPSLMVLLALTIAFVGVSGAYISQSAAPKASVQVNSVMDPDSIGAATTINLTLTNFLKTPVSPTFFVKWTLLTYIWNSNSTGPLGPGAERSYMITAPDARSAVPPGSSFHILIGDKLTGQILGESSSWKAGIGIPSLANPGLKWWVLDEGVGKRVPFGWTFSMINTDLTKSRITPLGFNGTSGLQMTLNYTSAGVGVEELALSQRALLNSTRVNFHFNQSFPTGPATASFETSLTDGTHTLYYVLSNQAAQQTTTVYATNTTITIPILVPQWNTINLDPVSIWTAQGWTLSVQVTLTMLVKSSTPGVYSATIQALNAA